MFSLFRILSFQLSLEMFLSITICLFYFHVKLYWLKLVKFCLFNSHLSSSKLILVKEFIWSIKFTIGWRSLFKKRNWWMFLEFWLIACSVMFKSSLISNNVSSFVKYSVHSVNVSCLKVFESQLNNVILNSFFFKVLKILLFTVFRIDS